MIKTRTWVLIIAAAALILLLSIFLLTGKTGSSVVEIVQDGAVLREIDLRYVTREYTITVESPDGGSNIIRVQPGRICVSEADCPDLICVRQGWLKDQSTPIVCLPHRLVIRLKNAPAVDAVSH